MAQAFPESEFLGFDYHEASIERSREAAKEGGVDDRIRSRSHRPRTSRANGYDLVTVFDCLHDMGDPAGASAHVRDTSTLTARG